MSSHFPAESGSKRGGEELNTTISGCGHKKQPVM